MAWFGILACVFAFKVGRQWQRAAPAGVPESTPASVKSQTAEPAPTAAEHARLQYLPEQHTDYVYSVVPGDVTLKDLLVLIGPPGLLTFAWVYARRRRHPRAPT